MGGNLRQYAFPLISNNLQNFGNLRIDSDRKMA